MSLFPSKQLCTVSLSFIGFCMYIIVSRVLTYHEIINLTCGVPIGNQFCSILKLKYCVFLCLYLC